MEGRVVEVSADAILDTIVDNVLHPIWVIDKNLALIRFNRLFAELYSDAFGTVPRRSMTLDQLLVPNQRPTLNTYWRDLYRRALAGRSVLTDSWYPIGGIKRCFSFSGRPFVEDGQVSGAVFSALDITDSERPEREDLAELALTRLFDSGKPLQVIL